MSIGLIFLLKNTETKSENLVFFFYVSFLLHYFVTSFGYLDFCRLRDRTGGVTRQQINMDRVHMIHTVGTEFLVSTYWCEIRLLVLEFSNKICQDVYIVCDLFETFPN